MLLKQRALAPKRATAARSGDPARRASRPRPHSCRFGFVAALHTAYHLSPIETSNAPEAAAFAQSGQLQPGQRTNRIRERLSRATARLFL